MQQPANVKKNNDGGQRKDRRQRTRGQRRRAEQIHPPSKHDEIEGRMRHTAEMRANAPPWARRGQTRQIWLIVSNDVRR
jgi:hypothetical protein